MINRTFLLASAGALALALAACSPPASKSADGPSASSAPMSSMPSTSAVPSSTPIDAVGVISALDTAAGTVTINHEAIAAIGWPAMSMQFKAENPSILQGVKVGDHVSFQLKSATDHDTVTMIMKQ